MQRKTTRTFDEAGRSLSRFVWLIALASCSGEVGEITQDPLGWSNSGVEGAPSNEESGSDEPPSVKPLDPNPDQGQSPATVSPQSPNSPSGDPSGNEPDDGDPSQPETTDPQDTPQVNTPVQPVEEVPEVMAPMHDLCSDVPPDDREPCGNWAEWGECENGWIKDHGYCNLSCGRCDNPPPTPMPEPEPQQPEPEPQPEPQQPAPEPEPPPPPPAPQPAPPRTGKFVGNITTSGALRSDFLQYWDQLTAENEGKWDAIEPTRDQMNWSKSDEYYQFAKSNGIPYKQHTFVWGSQEPGWMAGLSASEQAAEVEEYIRLFCERYPDVPMIDVVNEPDHATPSFAGALGGGLNDHAWVVWSFEKARQYCPNSILILNDYNVLRWDTDNFISIARKVASRGLLDAIGCQAHGLEDQSFAELQANFEKVAGVGVPIYISEYDIDEGDDTRQQQIMEQQFTFFYNEPRVAGITVWGYIHGATWRTDTGLIRNGQPRPAMTWLMNFLGR